MYYSYLIQIRLYDFNAIVKVWYVRRKKYQKLVPTAQDLQLEKHETFILHVHMFGLFLLKYIFYGKGMFGTC